jgi:hypothetical protein
VEQCFEEGKTELGMAQYEVRKYTGWHHHMLLTMLAHFFLWHLKGRILLANLEISFHCTTTDSCVDATTVNIRVEQRACRLVQTFAMEHFSGNVLQEIFM